MKSNQLKLIDFSKGIIDDEVMYNFNLLLDLLARERLNVAGWGYIKGLKVTYIGPDEKRNHFKLHMEEGTLINKKGHEVKLEATDLYIEYFNTVRESEVLDIGEDGVIELKYFPYVKNGYALLEYDKSTINSDNIEIHHTTDNIKIKDISGKFVTVDSRHSGKVRINYYRAEPKFDIITYAPGGQVRIHKGMESTSQSFYDTYKDEIVIAIVESIPHEYPKKKDAILKITQMWEISQRKIWIDRINDVLYICGEPFDGTQIIHMVEPKDPKENQLWYDHSENVIKIWRTIRGKSKWLTIGDKTFMRKTHNKIWEPGNLPQDMQTFMFDPVEDSELIYAAGTNALEIIIDNSVLMSDEYVEIISEENDPNYYNQGIGFKLNNPLVQPAYVEVKVRHEKRKTPRETRFERSGVFVDEKRLVIPYEKTTFKTDTMFLKDANQLEVFLNGKKLFNEKDYQEIELQKSLDNEEKNYCNTFTLLRPVSVNDHLVYRVTANLISYNDLSVYMEEVLEHYEKAKNNEDTLKKELLEIEKELDEFKAKQELRHSSLIESIRELNKAISLRLPKEEFENILEKKILNVTKINKKIEQRQIKVLQQNNYIYNLKELKEVNSLNILCNIIDVERDRQVILKENEDYIIDGKNIRFLNTSYIDNSKNILITGTTFEYKGVR